MTTQSSMSTADVYRYLETHLQLQDWMQHEVFSAQWWFITLLTIGSWVLWFRVFDRSRTLELVLFGLLIMCSATELDGIGMELVWWSYKVELVPLLDRLFPVDMAMLPVIYMFALQYWRRWPTYLVGQVALSFLFAFVAEPLAIKTGIYVMYAWRHVYSLPLYFAIPVLSRWLVERLMRIQRRARMK